MGLILTGLILVNLLGFAISVAQEEGAKMDVFKWLCPIFSIIVLFASGMVIWTSYGTYVDLRATYDATIEQYATSIEMYEDKAIIDVESAALTDFKYQGYQGNVAAFITELRTMLATYNKDFISKKKYASNWFFGWVIIPPDSDMKIISMRSAKNHKVKE